MDNLDRAIAGQWPVVAHQPHLGSLIPPCARIFFPSSPYFLHMWSILAAWLQYMPAFSQTFPKNFKHP